jgi:hypothetical protein
VRHQPAQGDDLGAERDEALDEDEQEQQAADRLDVGQDAHRQQRILQHDVGDLPAPDAVDALSRLVKTTNRLPQDRNLLAGDQAQPGCQVTGWALVGHDC